MGKSALSDPLNKDKEARRRKNIKELIQVALRTPLGEDRKLYWKNQGVDIGDEDFNVAFEMIMGQIKSAAAQGNTNAFKHLIELSEDIKSEDAFFELPARLLAKSFVDVNRTISAREYNEYIFKGGRYSTKSSFVGFKVIELIKQNPDMHALVVRPYENTLRDSVYAQLIWSITELEDNANWKYTTSPLQLMYKPTGQMIYLRGADDPGKIKSIKPQFGHIGILWFEELDQFKGEEQIRSVTQSALRGGDAAFVFKSFNPPKSRAAWANKYAREKKESMLVHHSTYLDVPREWIGVFALEEAEHLKEVNPDAYRHELLGEEIGDGGNVFDNLELRTITETEIGMFDHIYCGQDWGWYPDPNVFEAMHYDSNRRILYIYDEESGNKQTNEIWSTRIARYRNHQITADSAEQKSINDFRAWGYSMQGAIKGPGSVEYSMKWLGSLTKIVIDPSRCPLAAKEFVEYELERDKNGDVITSYPDKNNHAIDAVRYALEKLWRRAGV